MISDNCFVHIIYFHGNDANFVANDICILMKTHLNMFIFEVVAAVGLSRLHRVETKHHKLKESL